MAFVLVCLFTRFFDNDSEMNRKSRFLLKILLYFYKCCWKLSNDKSLTQHLELAFLVIWLLGPILATWWLQGAFLKKAFLLYPHSLI